MRLQSFERGVEVSDVQQAVGRYLRLSDVAELLQCSRRTIQRLVDSGEFPRPVKLGRQLVRWSEDEVREHLRRQRVMK
ncbi:MAG: helix-turn-helix transcriptional regulator [Phycisphaerae bacterium]